MFDETFPYSQLFLHTSPPAPGSSLHHLTARTLYLANSIVKSLVENNDYVRMRLVSAGSKVLSRQEKDGSQYRVMDEGLETLLPYIKTDDFVDGGSEDLRTLLMEYSPFFSKFREGPFLDRLTQHGMPSHSFAHNVDNVPLLAQGNLVMRFSCTQSDGTR